jgi:hypothetical protein
LLEERLTSHRPTKKKAQFKKRKWKALSLKSMGWSWLKVGEDGEDAWFGVSPEMGMVEWFWGFPRQIVYGRTHVEI